MRPPLRYVPGGGESIFISTRAIRMTRVLFTGAQRVRGVEREGGGGGRQGARDVRVGAVSGVI